MEILVRVHVLLCWSDVFVRCVDVQCSCYYYIFQQYEQAISFWFLVVISLSLHEEFSGTAKFLCYESMQLAILLHLSLLDCGQGGQKFPVCAFHTICYCSITMGWMNVAYFQQLWRSTFSCVMMQLAHVSLVCLVLVAGFVSTEGKDVLHVLKCCLNTTGQPDYCITKSIVCNNHLE